MDKASAQRQPSASAGGFPRRRRPGRDRLCLAPWQPVAKVALHSTGGASRLAALLLPQILAVFSVVVPGQPGAAPVSVRRGTSTTDC